MAKARKRLPGRSAVPLTETRTEIHRTELPGGIRVVSERVPGVSSLALGCWLEVGSRDEPEALAGISHFIEHAVFKRTRRRRTHQIARFMESVGGEMDAFTTKDHTCFAVRAMSVHLDRAVDILSDLIVHPVFPAHELEKEKQVVLEEIRMYRDIPEEVVFDRAEELFYPGHPLGRPILGYEETVSSFTREDVLDFKERHYGARRLVVAAAGDVEHVRLVDVVAERFRELPPGEPLLREAPEPALPGTHVFHHPTQQAHIVLIRPGYTWKDPRRLALQMLNQYLSGGMSGYLNQRVRERFGYCYSIYSFANMLEDTGDFGIYLATEPARAEEAVHRVLEELDRLRRKAIGARVFRQLQRQVIGQMYLSLESMTARMHRLGKTEMAYRTSVPVEAVEEAVEALTREAFIEVIEDILRPETFTRVLLVPERNLSFNPLAS